MPLLISLELWAFSLFFGSKFVLEPWNKRGNLHFIWSHSASFSGMQQNKNKPTHFVISIFRSKCECPLLHSGNNKNISVLNLESLNKVNSYDIQ